MIEKKRTMTILSLGACILLLFSSVPALGGEGGNISAGMTLPEFTMAGPGSVESQKYLGLENQEPFNLSQIQAKLVILEIFNTF